MVSRNEIREKLVHLQQRLLSLRNEKSSDSHQMAALSGLRTAHRLRLQQIFLPINELAGTEMALRFFYDELYPASVAPWRDEQCLRVLPRMVSVMPERASRVLLSAIELDWEVEEFDRELLALTRQGQRLGVAQHLSRRRLQLQLTRQVGQGLIHVVRLPMMGALLKCAKYPAKAKGLSELHGFFTRGFEAFRAIKQPDAFIERLIWLAETELDADLKRLEI